MLNSYASRKLEEVSRIRPHFPQRTFPPKDISSKDISPERHFPRRTFPLTDISSKYILSGFAKAARQGENIFNEMSVRAKRLSMILNVKCVSGKCLPEKCPSGNCSFWRSLFTQKKTTYFIFCLLFWNNGFFFFVQTSGNERKLPSSYSSRQTAHFLVN